MKKRVALAILGIAVMVCSLLLISCAKVPETSSTNTAGNPALSNSERITALEITIAQMSLDYEGVTIAQLKQLEANLQAQINALQAKILALESE